MSLPGSIAIDARTLTFQETGERGIGTYTISHIKAWARLQSDVRFKLLIERGGSLVRGAELLALPNISQEFYSLGAREFEGVDLFHVPDSMSMIEGYDSPFRMAPRGMRSSVLFHDLIPLALRKTIYDRWHSNIKRAYDTRLEHIREAKPLILANSEATRNDLISLAAMPAEKICVISAGLTDNIPHNPDSGQIAAAKAKFGINKPFLLVVGGLDEHKGFFYTLEACFELLKTEQLQIVIVGSMIDPWKAQIRDALARKDTKGVIFTGFVSDVELSCLYNEALALSFPSEYEGFGFPVLEAMAHGCPVICSDRASLPEVGGDAVIYLSSLDAAGVFAAIRKLLAAPGLREELKSKGRQRAESFRWELVAQKTVAGLKV